MSNINDILHRLEQEDAAGRTPFTVPEDYFQSLTDRVMARVHEQAESQASLPAERRFQSGTEGWYTTRLWRYAAAILVVAGVVGLAVPLLTSPKHDTLVGEVAESMSDIDFNYTDDEVAAILDYELISNNDISTYLTME